MKYLNDYLERLKVERNYSDLTIENYQRDILMFKNFCLARKICRIASKYGFNFAIYKIRERGKISLTYGAAPPTLTRGCVHPLRAWSTSVSGCAFIF